MIKKYNRKEYKDNSQRKEENTLWFLRKLTALCG